MSKVFLNGTAIDWDIKYADTFFTRLFGWIGKVEINESDALLLKPCVRIHTFGMRIDIDVLFLDHLGVILHLTENLKPNKLSPNIKKARSVIELSAGTIRRMNIQLGDKIMINNSSFL